MYESHLGCQERPFALVPDPRYFFASRGHREALNHLLYGIRREEGFVVVTGEVGTGKTTLCRTLLRKLDPQIETAVILNPSQSEEELLQAILGDLGVSLPSSATRKELLDALNAHLLAARAAGKRVVLIIDEAQDLPPRLLEQIRLLSNLETEREKLIQIILVGQVELSAKLCQRGLRQLNQRVAVRYRLPKLQPKETRAYILHRLARAGSERHDLFTWGALRLVHYLSGGIPRLINIICDRALVAMYARRLKQVTPSTIRLAWRSLYPSWDPVYRAVSPTLSLQRVASMVGLLAAALASATAGTVLGMWQGP